MKKLHDSRGAVKVLEAIECQLAHLIETYFLNQDTKAYLEEGLDSIISAKLHAALQTVRSEESGIIPPEHPDY